MTEIEKCMVVVLCSESVSPEEVLRCVDSINAQEDYFPYNVAINVNSNDKEYYNKVHKITRHKKDFIFQSPSNGGNGMGHNASLEYFESLADQEKFSHLIMIDGDDYYYPCAFECIHEISELVPFDYLSNMQVTDSVRLHETNQMHKEVVPGVWLHSNFNFRFPIPDYEYYDGWNCHGGEVTLCLSKRAVECGLLHLTTPNIPDDYTHMLYALKAHVERKLLFVNTDCNDVYVYDKTNPVGTTNQPGFKFNPDDWPEEDRNLLRGPTFQCLRGVNRKNLPWVTIPQVMDPSEKIDFVKENLINKGQIAP